MVKRLLGAGLVLVCIAAGAFGASGNARFDALSTPSILGDISNIQYFPGYISDYQDQVQLSIGGDSTIGPGIGIKSIGNFSVGVLAKNEWTLQGDFYSSARSELGPLTLTTPAQNVPHLLLGADFGGLKLGADLFYELGRASGHVENTVTAGKTVTDGVVAIRNPGIVIGLNLGLGDADLALKAGYTAPGITGDLKTVDPANTSISSTRNSIGVHGMVGGLITLPVMGADLTAGIDFEGQMFKFEVYTKSNTPAVDVIDKSAGTYSNLSLGLYVGAQKEIMNQLIVGAEYAFTFIGSSTTPDSVGYAVANRITNTTSMTNRITGYAEKTWASVLFLDSMQARIGATYQAVTPFTDSTSAGKKGDEQYVASTKGYTTWSLTPSLGLGMRKGVFQFDTYFQPTALLSVFKLVNGTYNTGGSDIFRATLSLDFGGTSSSSSSTSSYSPGTTEQSAPAPYTPATETAPVPMLGQ